jgi:hypothetical protein
MTVNRPDPARRCGTVVAASAGGGLAEQAGDGRAVRGRWQYRRWRPGAQHLSAKSADFVVENRPAQAARSVPGRVAATPDGYTLPFAASSMIVRRRNCKLSFDRKATGADHQCRHRHADARHQRICPSRHCRVHRYAKANPAS